MPYLTVSIHDVTPKFESELKEIIAELNFDVSKNENFAAWLHDLQKTGDEIVHHGYEHISHSRKYRSLKKVVFRGNVCPRVCRIPKYQL